MYFNCYNDNIAFQNGWLGTPWMVGNMKVPHLFGVTRLRICYFIFKYTLEISQSTYTLGKSVFYLECWLYTRSLLKYLFVLQNDKFLNFASNFSCCYAAIRNRKSFVQINEKFYSRLTLKYDAGKDAGKITSLKLAFIWNKNDAQ